MARNPTGQVVERKRKRGRVFALRFRAYGERQYVTLPDGTTRQEAERKLRHVLADVEREIWRPPEPEPAVEPREQEPTFHEFATEWWEDKRRELRPNTVAAYEWELQYLLLPFFAKHRLSEITVQEVDRYRSAMVRRRERLEAEPQYIERMDKRGRRTRSKVRPLSNESINKSLKRLAQVLEVAVEYELIDRNVAAGKRRRLKVDSPQRSYLDAAWQIEALLDGASKLDAKGREGDLRIRRAVLATLVLSGLRIGELGALRWRDVDLGTGRITVGKSKTDAGVRQVELLPALRDELAAWKARSPFQGSADLVFPTKAGGPLGASNVRGRVLAKSIERANEAREAKKLPPLPVGLTPHSMRRTFASLLFAIGRTPPEVMQQGGWTDPALPLRIYARAMNQEEGEVERLKTIAGLVDWAPVPNGSETDSAPASGERVENPRNAAAYE